MVKTLLHDSKVIGKIFIAESFLQRFLGYMLRKEPHHESILFKPCNSIHTFFMKFNIDVLFLDDNFIVVNKIENLKKGKIIMPQKGVTMVIEGEGGFFRDVSIGNRIDVVN